MAEVKGLVVLRLSSLRNYTEQHKALKQPARRSPFVHRETVSQN